MGLFGKKEPEVRDKKSDAYYALHDQFTDAIYSNAPESELEKLAMEMQYAWDLANGTKNPAREIRTGFSANEVKLKILLNNYIVSQNPMSLYDFQPSFSTYALVGRVYISGRIYVAFGPAGPESPFIDGEVMKEKSKPNPFIDAHLISVFEKIIGGSLESITTDKGLLGLFFHNPTDKREIPKLQQYVSNATNESESTKAPSGSGAMPQGKAPV